MAKRIVRHSGLEYRQPMRGVRQMPPMDLREPEELEGLDLREPQQMPEMDLTEPKADPEVDAILALAGEAKTLPTTKDAGWAGRGMIFRGGEVVSKPYFPEEQDGDEKLDLGPAHRLTTENSGSRRNPLEDRLGEQPVLIRGKGEEKFTPYPGYDENGNLLPEDVRAANAERATADTLAKVGFDPQGNPLKKAQSVVARAKGLPGSSRELSPEPERPQFARKPFTVSGAVADVVTAASPGKDAELEAARRDADLNTLAADLGEAGSMVAHAGLSKGHDKSRFDADRAVAGKPLDRLKEDRALADAELKRRIALEDKLRAAGREAEADKLKAERERWEMKHKDASLAETARHNKAMEALARAKGENNTGAGRKTNAEQQRHDALSIVEADLDRMYKLATDAKGARRGDIPGTGPIDSSSAVRWTKRALGAESPEAIQMEQASKSVLSNLAMMRSGKTVTEQEYQRLMASYGLMQDALIGGSEEAFWQGLNKFREDLKIIRGERASQNTEAAPGARGQPKQDEQGRWYVEE